MTLEEAKGWFSFLQEAPEGIKEYLLGTFWLLTFLILVWAILKLLFNKEFLRLYSILGRLFGSAGEISKKVMTGAIESLELPEPYPRTTRFFEIIFMVNTYAAFFLFSSLFLTFSILIVTSDITNFFQRTGGMLFTFVLGYFAWFCFAQAEKDRVRLFKNNE